MILLKQLPFKEQVRRAREREKRESSPRTPVRNVLKPTEGLRQFLLLGGGIQSTALLLMSLHGEIPMPCEAVLFADTGWERQATYEHVQWLTDYAKGFDVPVYTLSSGNNIKADALAGDDFAMPFFVETKAGGYKPGMRQCTQVYKISVVNRKIRELTGATFKNPVAIWIGFSADEVHRVKPARVKYLDNRYPLLELRMTREACQHWLVENGFTPPVRSSCVACPFHSDTSWQALSDEEFEEACQFDEAIRMTTLGKKQYVHRLAVPLRERKFVYDAQQELNLCGEGGCFT